MNLTLLFELPGGHWYQDKSLNTVVSMLHHNVDYVCSVKDKENKVLKQRFDNCAGKTSIGP